MSISDVASTAKGNLQEAANVLAASLASTSKATAGEQAPSKQELQTLTDGLKLEASKIGLMWGNSTPSPAEAESLLAGLEQRHSQLLTLFCRAGFRAGPTLLQSLQSAASPVTAACCNLIDFVSSCTNAQEGQIAVQAGKVWAACDAASTTAVDNKTAIGRKLLLVSRSVKDNIREVQGVIAESQGETPAQQLSHNDDEHSDVDLDFEAETLNPVELETAETSLKLIQVTLDVLKLLIRIILTVQDVSEKTSLDDWESLLFHCKGLADVSNDLAAALFAPQDTSEIISAADSLQTGCELVFDELPEDLRIAHAEPMASLAQQLSQAYNAVMHKLSVDVSSLTL